MPSDADHLFLGLFGPTRSHWVGDHFRHATGVPEWSVAEATIERVGSASLLCRYGTIGAAEHTTSGFLVLPLGGDG